MNRRSAFVSSFAMVSARLILAGVFRLKAMERAGHSH
jgi:hypothetical protein